MKDNWSVGQYLQNLDLDTGGEITEFNYITYYSVMHCWLLMNRTEKTELLQRLIPFMQHYGRSWYLTGLLYAQAVIQWMDDSHGVALKSTIESFVVNGEYRYVMAYCGFGQVGLEVLEAYVDWVYRNMPESWHRKKKYNYGNIHRMPLEDYLELVLRTAKRVAKHAPMTGEEMTERLTMMEMIILQNVSDGLSNAEICEELNLKLSTVKGHIYSVYKKLGVKSRMQAVLRSKEMGLLR
jgi:DNA-binding CsgD family transcriptional regulator